MAPSRPLVAAGLGLSLVLGGCSTEPQTPPTPSPDSLDQSGDLTQPGSPRPDSLEPDPQQASPVAPTGESFPLETGLDAPWSIAFLGSTGLVSERDSGQILEFKINGGGTSLVGTVPGITHGGEGGLLGIAVDGTGHLYAYSTGANGNRIQRFDITGEPGALTLGTGVTLVDKIPSAGFHNGGRLAFGPDGMLYATTGDAGETEQAQDLTAQGGKILRIMPDGSIPSDNPFPDSPVYSYGHRNSQGLTWAEDGTMFATEFGQNTWDELNIIVPGANYGWPIVEGFSESQEFVNPVQQWATADASPSGMSQLGGTLFIANLRGEVLRTVPVAAPNTSTEYFQGEFGRIRATAITPEGRLWILTNNTDGRGTPGIDDDQLIEVDIKDSCVGN